MSRPRFKVDMILERDRRINYKTLYTALHDTAKLLNSTYHVKQFFVGNSYNHPFQMPRAFSLNAPCIRIKCTVHPYEMLGAFDLSARGI